MKIVKPTVKKISIVDPIEKIETIARICTQSTNNKKRKKGELLKQCLKLKHYSILEHFRIEIEFDRMFNCKFLRKFKEQYVDLTKHMHINNDEDEHTGYIECDLRKIRELIERVFNESKYADKDFYIFAYMLYREFKKQKGIYSLILKDINIPISEFASILKSISDNIEKLIESFPDNLEINFKENLLKNSSEIHNLLFMKIKNISPQSNSVTFKITTSRGVCMQLLRHRNLSFMMESTRYCKYNNGITVVKPIPYKWAIKENEIYKKWKNHKQNIENMYLELLNMINSAQEASGILPKDLKADLIIT